MRRRPSKLVTLPEHVIATPARLAAATAHLSAAPIIGFDTEFVGEDSYRPELCLVQVSSSQALFVIDPFACGPLDAFWEVMTDPAKVIVVHAGREDLRICNFAAGKAPAKVYDVQVAAGLAGLSWPIGYAGLVSELLGHRMNKGETLTDWRRRPLAAAQLRYAFDDVRFLLPAHKKLTDRLTRDQRLEWAEEEFVTFTDKAVADDVTAERWRRVKGTGGFDPRGLAAVRELHAWRDGFAHRVNRPARMLMRDDVLAEIARRLPKSLDDLQNLRGLPRGEQDAILSAVSRARALAADELPGVEPKESDSPQITLMANLLGVVLTDLCSRMKLASNLVATTSDLKAVARSRACGGELPDVQLTRGWRGRHILPELLAVLDGHHALRVVKPTSLAPLAYLPVSEPLPAADATLADGPEESAET
ncbi:ribonuclease D [Urbifossiella limnaea]|uniref:Ribonuclease D n=1 Tax=Urbifossiella limnaea TaxID=2528023 RepID=A0A517XSI5_9BACT|nr:HRDC domain-containing protein [Urbifossiella limnaea]QDU20475.1 Ribonuclease D [Urbifossiella limnaea]